MSVEVGIEIRSDDKQPTLSNLIRLQYVPVHIYGTHGMCIDHQSHPLTSAPVVHSPHLYRPILPSGLLHKPHMMEDQVSYILGLPAVRENAHIILQAAREGKLNHFDYHADKLSDTADYVIGMIQA